MTVRQVDEPRTVPAVTPGWSRLLWATGWLLLAAMVFHIGWLALTGDTVTGPISLRKPATFAETGWLTTWSVALVLPHLATRAWQRHVIGVCVLAFCVGETTIIGFQAWRGVPSHYNFTTTLDSVLMRGGAGGLAFVFLVGMVVLLVATLRTPGLSRSLTLGIVGGTVVLLAGCVVGFVMISNMSGVFQGTFGSAFGEPQTGYLGPSAATVGPEHVLLRPDTDGGDLVLPHAIGVHGLPLVMLPALLLVRTRVPERTRLRYVGAIAGGTVVAMGVLCWHAFAQLPLSELSVPQVVVIVLAAAAVLGGWWGAARAALPSGR